MKERIEQILGDKGITQAEFANRAGISPATITHLFNGRNNLSETVISKILLAYPEINPVWLLEGTGEKYQKQNTNLPLFNQEQESIEKQPIAPPPIQLKEQMISPVDSAIAQASATTQPLLATNTNVQKQIRKIVFFYADKTFEEYYPE